jgi:hypothetical protein
LFQNDAWSMSIMSYFDQSESYYFANQNFTNLNVVTPMIADILAMQNLYGLSTTTRFGDTVYGYHSNAGGEYDATAHSNVALTIFDSGGNDTLDYSGAGSVQLINLNPEAFSNVNGYIGNLAIARGVLIENAIGGAGGDTIIGNSADNVITGGGGTDTLTGGAGFDTFRDTTAGLSGDTITDFRSGDRIVITDAKLPGFTFNVIGNTVTFTGGSLTLGSLPGNLVAQVAAGGGVELAIERPPTNDFNGDGISDVLWRNDTGTLTDWLGTSNGSFTGNWNNSHDTQTTVWDVVGTGDVNGDGRVDVIWRNSSGTVTDWLGAANGGFVGNFANADLNLATTWTMSGTGDFDGDGRSDILWRNSDGTVTNWLGTSNGSWVGNFANANVSLTTNWSIVGVGDFNGDGHDDVLWRNSSGTITDWLGADQGSFVGNWTNANLNLSTSWQVVGTGDFNGDGRSDILWRDANGTITDWLGTANGGFVGNFNNAAINLGNNWQVMGVGDYNGDGRDDIAFRDSAGHVTNWLGTSTGGWTDNSPIAGTFIPPEWHAQHNLL